MSIAYSYDSTYDTVIIQGGDIPVTGDCFDLDLFSNTTKQYLKGNAGNTSLGVSVSCSSPDADIKCNAVASQSRWITLNDMKITESRYTDPQDAYGLVWVGDDTTVSDTSFPWDYHIGVTTKGNYYKIDADSYSGQSWCYNHKLVYKNITYAPYFNHTEAPISNYELASFTLSDNYQDDNIYISPLDLGITNYQHFLSVLRYNGLSDWLYVYNGTKTKSAGDIEYTGDLALLDTALIGAGSNCLYPDLYVTDTERTGIADPPTALNLWCVNASHISLPYDGVVMGFSIINHTDVRDCPVLGLCGIEIDLKMIYYDAEYLSISNVAHTPEIPLAGGSVRVSWETTRDSDSTLFWRSSPATNRTYFSGWSSKYDNDYVYYHELNINGSSIQENRYYQYYVVSNRTVGTQYAVSNYTSTEYSDAFSMVYGSEVYNHTVTHVLDSTPHTLTETGISGNYRMAYMIYNFTGIIVTPSQINITLNYRLYNLSGTDNTEKVIISFWDTSTGKWEQRAVLNQTFVFYTDRNISLNGVSNYVQNGILRVHFNDSYTASDTSQDRLQIDYMAITITGNTTYISSPYYTAQVNDTNNGLFYNFSVFGSNYQEYIGESNITAPTLAVAVDRLADALGMDSGSILNAVGMFVLLLFTGMVLLATHRLEFGIAVFTTGVAVLSLLSWLPSYMFIVMTVVVAIILAMILRKVVSS